MSTESSKLFCYVLYFSQYIKACNLATCQLNRYVQGVPKLNRYISSYRKIIKLTKCQIVVTAIIYILMCVTRVSILQKINDHLLLYLYYHICNIRATDCKSNSISRRPQIN